MTTVAHRTKRKPAAATRRRPDVQARYATGPRKIIAKRLKAGEVTLGELTAAAYGVDTPANRRKTSSVIGHLKAEGWEIEGRGSFILRSTSGDTSTQQPRLRTPEGSIRRCLDAAGYHPTCECGQPATCVARFWQFTADEHSPSLFLNALLVCDQCKADFLDAHDFLTLEKAYEISHAPLPPALATVAKSGSTTNGAPAATGRPGRRDDRPEPRGGRL